MSGLMVKNTPTPDERSTLESAGEASNPGPTRPVDRNTSHVIFLIHLTHVDHTHIVAISVVAVW